MATPKKLSKVECDLSSCFLCHRCTPEWLPAVRANRVHARLKKGEMLFREGDPVKGIFFIYNGVVKVHKKWGAEKELILRFARKGHIVGHRGLGGDAVYPISATALEDVTFCYVDLPFFMASLKVNYDFILELTMFLAEEIKESEEHMRNLAHMQVKGRLAKSLLLLREKFGSTPEGFIDILLSRQDIASYTGTSYETVFRTMNEFIEEGSIRVDGRKIWLQDMEKLIHYIDESG